MYAWVCDVKVGSNSLKSKQLVLHANVQLSNASFLGGLLVGAQYELHIIVHVQAKLSPEAKQKVQAVFAGEPTVEDLYYAVSTIASTGKKSKSISCEDVFCD